MPKTPKKSETRAAWLRRLEVGKATYAEMEVLALVLREMRHAVAIRCQLSITFDPFTAGGGAIFFAGYSSRGFSREIRGELRAKRQRGSRR